MTQITLGDRGLATLRPSLGRSSSARPKSRYSNWAHLLEIGGWLNRTSLLPRMLMIGWARLPTWSWPFPKKNLKILRVIGHIIRTHNLKASIPELSIEKTKGLECLKSWALSRALLKGPRATYLHPREVQSTVSQSKSIRPNRFGSYLISN